MARGSRRGSRMGTSSRSRLRPASQGLKANEKTGMGRRGQWTMRGSAPTGPTIGTG